MILKLTDKQKVVILYSLNTKKQMMKNLWILCAVFGLFWSQSSNAQLVNKTNLRFSVVSPSSSFGSLSGFNRKALADGIENPDKGDGGVRPFESFDSRTGFGIDLGNIFYIRNTTLPENMGVGIDASFLNFNWVRVNNRGMHNDASEFEFTNHFLTYQLRVGAIYTYSPVPDIHLDYVFRWAPTGAALIGSYNDNPPDVDGAKDRHLGFGYGLRRFNTGLYVRYNVLTLGFEWDFGGSTFSTRSSDMSSWYSSDVPLNSLRFIFGFNFVRQERVVGRR